MRMNFSPGDVVSGLKKQRLTVTDLDVEVLPLLRAYLIAVARHGGRTTYGQMADDLELTHAKNGLGRLLDLLSEDCILRKEPSLAALVVSQSTDEVGKDFLGNPVAERYRLYTWWS